MSNEKSLELENDWGELCDSFVQETYLHLAVVEVELLGIEKKPCNERYFTPCLDAIHTIKGTAACLELNDIAEFCHELEGFVKDIESGEMECSKSTIGILLKRLDFLRMACSDVGKLNFAESETTTSPEGVLVSHEDLKKIQELGEEAMALQSSIEKAWKPHLGTMGERAEELGAIILEQRKLAMKMNKVPFSKILIPLQNFVKNYDKRIEMVADGEDLGVDGAIGKMLGKVLVHIVNNSLEHGIESVGVRQKMGKPETGRITARCYEKDNKIIVEMEDDGYGFDMDKIAFHAVSKKMFNRKYLDSMSEEDLLNIVFESGFSTAEKITQTSGRGIGMSSVRSMVESMDGRIELHNNPCQGSVVKIVIPVPCPMQLVKLLNVKILESCYSIPSDDVCEVVNCKDVIIHKLENSWIMGYGDHLLPLIHLGKYLERDKESLFDVEDIVIVESGSYFYGLIVENIDGMEESIVKKIKGVSGREACYSGVSSTKHGEVSLVLNVKKIGQDSKIKGYKSSVEKNTAERNVSRERFILFDLKEHKNYVIHLNDIFCIESIRTSEVDWTGDLASVPYRGKTMSLIHLERALNLCRGKKTQYQYLNVLVIRKGTEYFGLIVDKIVSIEESASEPDATISDRKGISGVVVFEDRIASLVDVEFLLQSIGLRKSLVA